MALSRINPQAGSGRPRRRSAKKVNELTSPHIRTQSSGNSIVSAQTSTLIGAEIGIQNHCRSAQPMSLMGHFRQIDPLPTLSACPLRSDRVRTFAPQRIDAVGALRSRSETP
jgi:hypothetical protein